MTYISSSYYTKNRLMYYKIVSDRAGDVYAAIRDCYTAIHYDPYHVKSHFRLAKALMELKKAKEAHECLIYFKDKFPKQANAHAVWLLQKDINLALNNLESSAFAGSCI